MKYKVLITENGYNSYLQNECDGLGFTNSSEEEVKCLSEIALKQGYSVEITKEKED